MLTTIPLTKGLLGDWNVQRLRDVLSSFDENDLRIICCGGQSILGPSLLFAMSSCYLKGILSEIFDSQSKLDIEPVTLFLPDFDVESVNGLIQVQLHL